MYQGALFVRHPFQGHLDPEQAQQLWVWPPSALCCPCRDSATVCSKPLGPAKYPTKALSQFLNVFAFFFPQLTDTLRIWWQKKYTYRQLYTSWWMAFRNWSQSQVENLWCGRCSLSTSSLMAALQLPLDSPELGRSAVFIPPCLSN